MEIRQREIILNRIKLGYSIFEFEGNSYKLRGPSKLDNVLADKFYEETLYHCSFSGIYQEEDLKGLLEREKIWIEADEEKIKKMEKQLEELKVQIYMVRMDDGAVAKLRKNIAAISQGINIGYERKHSLDHLGVKGYANLVRRRFLVERALKTKNSRLIDAALQFLTSSVIPLEHYREVARSEPWRSYWDISKPRPFKKHPEDWTDEQKTLVRYSKMYDGIFKHPECPSDQVIEDDNMLDGWIILQNRERDKSMKEKEGDSLVSPAVGKHKEQFISSTTYTKVQDIDEDGRPIGILVENNSPSKKEKIEALNSPESKRIKEARQKMINEKGKVKETQLPDIQRDKINMIRRK